jgi:hypothetical protein
MKLLTALPYAACPFAAHNITKGVSLYQGYLAFLNVARKREYAVEFGRLPPGKLAEMSIRNNQAAADGLHRLMHRKVEV